IYREVSSHQSVGRLGMMALASPGRSAPLGRRGGRRGMVPRTLEDSRAGVDSEEKAMTATTTEQACAKLQAAEGREGKGGFTKGKKGGPGNPYARQVARLRKTLVNFVTEEDMKHIAFVLKMKAESGDITAIKLLFQYVLGKPTEAIDPDRLDVD